MEVLSRHPWARWSVPVAVAALAVGGTTLVTRVTANAQSALPSRSAAQLLVDLQTAKLTTGSGTIVQKADLGLPALPTIGGAGSSDLSSLISGNHTLRVWFAGPAKARLALMGTLGESDVIRNSQDLWIWSSKGNSATHRVLSPESAGKAADSPDRLTELARGGLTPQQAADQALAAIDPTTVVTTDGTAQVAGRSAYELLLAPKDTSSLVGQVEIAVDAVRHVPLRVQVFAKNATTPAVEVAFTQVSFARPADSQFRFTPPPGAKITQEKASPSGRGTGKLAPGQAKLSGAKPGSAKPGSVKPGSAKPDGTEPVFSGTGWTTVLQAKLPAEPAPMTKGAARAAAKNGPARSQKASPAAPNRLERILGVFPRVSGSWGSGRLLHSSLFTVLLTDDGRILAGAVPAQRLYQLAAQPLPTATK